jgi:thiamine biosynthesis lipoprotein ApbE
LIADHNAGACIELPKDANDVNAMNAIDLDALAARLLCLPKEERARLAAILLGNGRAGSARAADADTEPN